MQNLDIHLSQLCTSHIAVYIKPRVDKNSLYLNKEKKNENK